MKHSFQTEINQLLDLMIHSLYSNKEIFLRELVSNASDALDKLNYLTLSDDKFKSIEFKPQIKITFNEEKKLLSIEDNGIGMNESELIENLGTIAKSGTKGFLNALSGDKKKDSMLIGQFGVGFYSSFMVADKVIVTSKKALEDKAFSWISDGKGEYEIQECIKDSFGTKIDLYLKDDAKEYANRWRIDSLIKKYSDHIAFPIILSYDEKQTKEDKSEEIIHKEEQINKAKALWKIPKNELSEDDYNEFYQNLSHDNTKPLSYIHNKVEGSLEYTTLFYIPSRAPFDLFRVDYKSGVKLYVKRVFITDDDKELLPQYLRFIRGIIDSEDLPLNVSREILQQNKILANIKSASTKKILSEIENLSKDEEKYKTFHNEFGKLLKEGLYSDYENKDKLLNLCRFATTKGEFVSLSTYKQRAKDENIYYIIGSDLELLRNSPLLEKYTKDDIEVLLLNDEVDSFIMPSLGEFEGLKFKDVAMEDNKDEISKEIADEYKDFLDKTKGILEGKIKDIRLSTRLDKSPSCVISEGSNPMMEQLMRQMGQEVKEESPIFEINPNHAIIKKLKDLKDDEKLKDIIFILFDSAKLLEKGGINDANSFSQRINNLIMMSV
ncbi:molecular chaperone HtpG [Helicobacter sp. MIT 99-5507]|uniref:molecular chaperone HtpG n=1 Tax=Helicobacter sp. MIT 99-5507 TaxID=152489 RepID=UPI000E1F693F|nr:molecular chaperone HtpG [Helicobacter sp. MIT 99-5507]RDU57815.1 molecular chaperone HtpG [Helicobacter sp. MIT 99-5507]